MKDIENGQQTFLGTLAVAIKVLAILLAEMFSSSESKVLIN